MVLARDGGECGPRDVKRIYGLDKEICEIREDNRKEKIRSERVDFGQCLYVVCQS